MARITLVEDEQELAALTARALTEAGHEVEVIGDGQQALDRLLAPGVEEPDLVVLDIGLPGVDGLEICRRVRRTRITPILMLTARSTELDKVLGLELGADDYLTKPFAARELQARVSAILRRMELMREQAVTADPTPSAVVHPGLRVDPDAREVAVDGTPVTLTPREFDLLYLLASHPGRVFSREYLLERVWRDVVVNDRTVDTHIGRVRQKIAAVPGGEAVAERIVTLWGIGYKYQRPTGGR